MRHAKPSVIKEAAKCIPAAEAAIDRFGRIVVPGELGTLLAQPRLELDDQGAATWRTRKMLPRSKTVDLALNGEQNIDALDRLGRDRRPCRC